MIKGLFFGGFTRCDRCISTAYCGQRRRCGMLDAEANLAMQAQLNAAWQEIERVHQNTIDIGPDAVREVRSIPLLGVDAGGRDRQSVCAARTHADGSIEIIGMCEYTGEADSDGGECD